MADPIIYAVRMRSVRLGYVRVWTSVVQTGGRILLGGPRNRSSVQRRIFGNRSTDASTTETGRRSNYVVTTTTLM